MKREEISLISEERKVYDKKDIVLSIKNSTYYDVIQCLPIYFLNFNFILLRKK